MSHIISAGSITGPHHVKNNEENQDHHYSITENGVTVIAVADGAGSLSLSLQQLLQMKLLMQYLTDILLNQE
jgi:hypothetical protein